MSVQRAYTDDALAVSLTASKKTIYEGEQFYVTLGFHTYEHFEGGLQATDMSTGNDFIVHRSDLNNMEFKPVEGSRREMQASAKFAWLSPTKSGNLQIPPFKFKYTKRGEPKIVEEKKQMGGMSFSSRTVKQESIEAEATSPIINITVKPLPAEGKPDNFSGMVGDYKFSAEFDRTNLKVGEALTLSINIRGDGTPGTIADPKLPDFGDFRSVPPENNISKKITGNKVITPVVQGPAAVQKQEIESLGSDIRYIHAVGKAHDSARPYKSIAFWIIFAAAIPFYILVNLAITRRRKHNNDAALVRKGKADKMLKARFANARAALKEGNAKALYAALENGLIDYLSDRTNLEFKGMTRPQMKEELSKLGVKEETIAAIDSWLEKCAFARFAPVNPSAEEQKQMLADVEKLCEGLKV